MEQKKMKRTCIFFLIAISAFNGLLFPSSYSDFYADVTDILESFSDQNAGSSSFPSLVVPLGGRSESMGTAYTAIATDTAFINYNPAASALLPYTELSVFHNFWIADSAIDTVVFSKRSGNLGYGGALKSFYVPFTEYNLFGERVSRGYYSETIGMANIAYNFLAGYDFKGITFGANLKFGFRGVPNYTDEITGQVLDGSGINQSAIAIMGDIGFLMQCNALKLYSAREPNFTIGIAATNVGVAFSNLSKGLELDNALPTQVAVGVSYKMIRPLTVSVDFIQPINLIDFSRTEKFSFCLGLEAVLTDFFSVQTGFLLKGGNPKISLGSQLDWKKMTFSLGYSLDFTSSMNPLNKVSLSAKINLGDEGRSAIRTEVDLLYSKGLNEYVNGEFSNAIATWNEALLLYPRFDPALDGIFAAEQSLSLRTTIQDVQSLDSSN